MKEFNVPSFAEHSLNEGNKFVSVINLGGPSCGPRYYFDTKTKTDDIKQWVETNINNWVLGGIRNNHVEIEKHKTGGSSSLGVKIQIVNNHTNEVEQDFIPYKSNIEIIKL